jgi:hypothetical protein
VSFGSDSLPFATSFARSTGKCMSVEPFHSPAVHAKALDCGQLSLDPCYGQPKVLSALQWIDKTMDKEVDKRRQKKN